MTTRAQRPVGFVTQMNLKRLALGMGHGAWAGYLCMDRSLWYRLRRGEKELTIGVIQRVLREWPEEFEPFLRDAVLAWRDPAGPAGEEQEPGRVAC